jgi:cytochrome c peroxidase
LATFLRSMVSQNSRMDQAASVSMNNGPFSFWDPWTVTNDDIQLDGFSSLEQQGFELFHGKMLCASCHNGPSFNGWGGSFADIGLDMGELGQFSAGGWGATAMKVPSLRNVALTAPYMHDGRFASLDDVLDHYSHGILDSPTLDSRLRNWDNASPFIFEEPFIDFFPFGGSAEAEPVRLNMTPGERAALLAFMGTLTDLDFVKDVRYSDPFTSSL